MASEAEEFILKLNEQVSPAARVAESAIAQLEAQIASNQTALMEYESELLQAKRKLEDLAQAAGRNQVSIAAYRRQQRAVAQLEQKATDARQALDRLGNAKPMAEQVSQFQRAEQAIRSAADALEELRARQQLVSQGGGNADAFTASIQRQRLAVMQAQRAYVQMGGSARVATMAGGNVGAAMQRVGESAKRAHLDLGQLDTSFSALGGAAGESGARMAELGEAFQVLRAMGPAALIGGVVVVVLALAAALVTATAAAVKWAVSMADAARSQRLSVESLKANYAALENLEQMLPRVQAQSGLARQEIQDLAAQLAKAKVPAANMEAALSAMAIATAGGANQEYLAKLEAGLKATGKIPAELADQFAKFENVAKAKMLSLDSISMRFKENIGGLFADLDLEPLLSALEDALSIFDTTTEHGKALRTLVTHMFQPMVDFATRMFPVVERLFLQVAIAGLDTYIAIRDAWNSPIGKRFRKGLHQIKDLLMFLAPIAKFVFEYAVVAPLKVAGGAVAAFVIGIGVIGEVFDSLSARASEAWGKITSEVDKAIASIKGKSLLQIGIDMMAGLAKGIIEGGTKVFKAIADVVGGAISGAKKQLDENSPSRVFMQIGADTSEGMAIGVRGRAPRVQEEMAAMVRVPPVLAANDNAKAWGQQAIQPAVEAARQERRVVVARDGSDAIGVDSGSSSAGAPTRNVYVSISNCNLGDGMTEARFRKWIESVFEDESSAVAGAIDGWESEAS